MSNSSSSDSEYENETEEPNKDELVQQSLLTMNGNEALGSWERHTRGMGSKLMASMGYVTGTGLGKRADGRVEPVEATVLPAGKSLGVFFRSIRYVRNSFKNCTYQICFQTTAWNYVKMQAEIRICFPFSEE